MRKIESSLKGKFKWVKFTIIKKLTLKYLMILKKFEKALETFSLNQF